MMKQVLLASSLLALGAFATGCASTAKGVKNSVVNASVPSESLRADVPDGGVLAVIRYPAMVEDSAKDAYHRAYAKRAIGGTTGRGVTNTVETVAVADGTIIKSNYYALSLYKELAAKLPEHGVLLSPHAIKLGPGGELTSEPMTSAEELPSVVSVDFATYSFPDSKKMMKDVPLTFGDLITPLVTVRTDHRAAAPTQGLLMASKPLVSRAAAEGREVALDIYTDGMARRIVALINGLDTDKAVMMGKAASVAEFDPSLAALTFVGSDKAHEVLETQRKLQRQKANATLGAIGGVIGGLVIGSQCRARTRSSSSNAYRQCVQQNDPTVRRSSGNVLLGNAMIQAGILAAKEASEKARLSQQVASNYLNSIVPVLEQQTTVTVDLLDSNETITAIRYEDLQAKLQSLYTSRQRALDTVATQCAYLGEDGVKRGTWLGVCDGGLANGSGAGVLESGEDVVEYYGYAKNGFGVAGRGICARGGDYPRAV